MEAWNRNYRKGLYIAICVILIPFLIYAHLLIDPSITTISFFSFNYQHSSFETQTFLWILSNSLVPFLLLIIMFFTTYPKWKYGLLLLIFLYFLNMATIVDIFPDYLQALLSLKGFLIGLPLIIFIIFRDKRNSKSAEEININHTELETIKLGLDNSFKKFMNSILSTKGAKFNLSSYHYLRKIIYLKIALREKYSHSLTRLTLEKRKTVFLFDAAVILLFVVIILLWFLPYQISDHQKSIEFMGLFINDHGFNDVSIFIWFVTRKLIVIIFLSLWFITCPFWWRYAILSPLIIYSYQFWEAFQNVSSLDAYSNIKILPLVLLNVLLVLLISKRIMYKAKFLTLYESILGEIEEILEQLKGEYPTEVAKTISEIKSNRKTHSEAAYRKQLKSLERELSARLDLKEG